MPSDWASSRSGDTAGPQPVDVPGSLRRPSPQATTSRGNSRGPSWSSGRRSCRAPAPATARQRLVLVVPEDDHLPEELGIPRPPPRLVRIDLPDVVEHAREIALAPIDLVRLPRGAVDRARDDAELASDHRLE